MNAQDIDERTALLYAVRHANINCLKSLITNGADVNTGNDSYAMFGERGPSEQWTAILVAIENIGKNTSAINVDIFDFEMQYNVQYNVSFWL